MLLLIILLPLFIYMVVAITVPKATLSHPDQWFALFRKVGTTPFSNSAIAYAFQVASIYPFMLWAAHGILLVSLLNSLFWGIGIILFAAVLPRLRAFASKDRTIHGLLGDTYGPRLRPWTSLVTVVGLLGLAIGEVVWGSAVVKPMLPHEDFIYMVIFLFLFSALTYVSYGGQASSIRTDQVQLLFSYLGVAGVVVYLAYLAIFHGSHGSWPLQIMAVIMIPFTLFVLALRRWRFLATDNEVTSYGKRVTLVSNVSITAGLVLITLGLIAVIWRQGWLHPFYRLPPQFTGFGRSGILAICLLPLFWQFVDMANWQRLLCLRGQGDAATENNRMSEMRRGFCIFALESPWTWMMFIALGALAAVGVPACVEGDSFTRLPSLLVSSTNILDKFIGYMFVVSVMAIMLSTVDSVLSAAMFAFVYDTWKPTRQRLDANTPVAEKEMPRLLATARTFGLVSLLALFVMYVVFDRTGKNGEKFISALFAFYSAQLALAPVVFGAIFLSRRWLPSQGFALASVGVGATAGVGLGFYSLFFDSKWQWWPVLVSLILSFALFIVGSAIAWNRSRRSLNGATV